MDRRTDQACWTHLRRPLMKGILHLWLVWVILNIVALGWINDLIHGGGNYFGGYDYVLPHYLS